MSLYLLRWNPELSSYKLKNLKELKKHVDNHEQPMDFNWSIDEWDELAKDDFFLMQQVGTKHDGICMIGKFKDCCYEGPSWKKGDNSRVHYADMWMMNILDCEKKNILSAKKYKKLFPEIKWDGGHSGIKLDNELGMRLMDEIEKDMMAANLWTEESIYNFMKFEGKDYTEKDWRKPTKEDLSDGTILEDFKNKFIESTGKEDFVNLVCCLHDSDVWVPMRVGEENGKKVYYPLTLVNEENMMGFPMFSNPPQFKGHYDNLDYEFEMVHISVLACIDYLNDDSECEFLVLDAFTNHLEINKDLANLIKDINMMDN